MLTVKGGRRWTEAAYAVSSNANDGASTKPTPSEALLPLFGDWHRRVEAEWTSDEP
jgi:hypothetical protein